MLFNKHGIINYYLYKKELRTLSAAIVKMSVKIFISLVRE